MTIYVNLHDDGAGRNNIVSPVQFNNLGTPTTTGVRIADLVDENNVATGRSLTVDVAFPAAAGSSTWATSGSGNFPQEFFDSAWEDSTDSGTISISATNGETYTLLISGHHFFAARDTNFSATGADSNPYFYDDSGTETPTAPITITGTVTGGKVTISTALVSVKSAINGFSITFASDSIDSIDSPVLDAEQNNAFTYSGFASGAPTSFTIETAGSEYTSANLLDTAAGGSGTWDMPDVAGFTVPTAMIPFDTASWGSKIVTLSNGTESDTDTTVINEKANWHVIEVDTPITTIGSLFYVAGGWTFAAPANTDQVYYYSTETVDDQAADYFVIAADGTITTNLLSGSVPFVFWDASDGIGYPDTVTLSVEGTNIMAFYQAMVKSRLKR